MTPAIFIIYQAVAAIAAACGPDQPWGCVTWLEDAGDTRDRACMIHIPVRMNEEGRAATLAQLRPQCIEGGAT